MSAPLRLLLVEDSPRDAAFLIRILQRGFPNLAYERVTTAETLTVALTRQDWDLIICDYTLPSFNALTALTLLRQRQLDLPLIVVSGTVSDEVAVECMRQGAADYLLKDRLGRLVEAVRQILATRRLRAAQEKAEQSLRLQARLLDSVEQAVIAIDLAGTIIYWNRFAEVLYGWVAADVLGHSAGMLIPNATALEQAEAIMARLRAGDSWSGEFQVQRRDGSTFPAWVSDSPIYDEHGALIGFVGVSSDITERKATEAALRESEQRFRQVEEQAPIGLALVAPDGRWLRVNPALCALVGYDAEELLARTFQDITHPDDLNLGLDYARRVLAGEIATYQLEKRYIRKNGTHVWALLSVSLVRHADGYPLYFIAQVQDLTDRKRAEEALRHQALHDSLTGLPNRVRLGDLLTDNLRTAHATAQSLSLMLVDLDRFKEVNDTLGHQVGDILLRQVAGRLQQALGATETLARLGGDEFAIVLPAADAAAALVVARLILQSLVTPFEVGLHLLDLGASVGVAVYPEHGTEAEMLLQHADVAMYIAKRAQSGVAVYEPALDLHTVRRLALMRDLRRAILDEELSLHYQPKVAIATMQVCGVEALLRWTHPEHGFIPPDEFIPLAEQTGLIASLTEWVLLTALTQARAWRETARPLSVAANLSTRSLQDPHFPEVVARLLRRFEVAPTDLTLEITESSLMTDPPRARDVLIGLHDLGVRLEIDDFGTGYSSLGYLKRLPVDGLKVDRSFMQHLLEDPHDEVIVASTIGLAHSLGLRVVAEGVETQAALARLTDLGCDVVQGYFLSRPLPAEALGRWLHEYSTSRDEADSRSTPLRGGCAAPA